MRADFTEAGVAFVLPEQKRNLQRLHDHLQARGILPLERVLTATNYQQGRFLALPTHVLVVTLARIAYTHSGGIRSIPLNAIDLCSVRTKAGVANGVLQLSLRSGEQLTFTKGISLCIQEVAATLQTLGAAGGESVGTPPDLVAEWGDGPDSMDLDVAAPPADLDVDLGKLPPLRPPENGYQYTDAEITARAEAVEASMRPQRAPLRPWGPKDVGVPLPTGTVFAKPIPGRVFATLRDMPVDETDLAGVTVGLLDPGRVYPPDTAPDYDDVLAFAGFTRQPEDPNEFHVLTNIGGKPLPWPGAPGNYVSDYSTWLNTVVRVPDGADAASTIAVAIGDLLGPGTWVELTTNARSTWARNGAIWTEAA